MFLFGAVGESLGWLAFLAIDLMVVVFLGECLMVGVWVPDPHKEMDQNDYCGETRSG